ncbi:MAG: hypothetical protein PHD72_04580 [Patescibacteria group bacterium]|nr:hypothetical protein [Patescibacteria group bacterium]
MRLGERHSPTPDFIDAKKSTTADFDAVHIRAEMRRHSQELRINALNLQQPWSTDAMRERYDADLARVNKEAGGQSQEDISAGVAAERHKVLLDKAEETAELFPDLAALAMARAAKMSHLAGVYPDVEMNAADKYLLACKNIPKIAPSSLLADATLLGLQKTLAEKSTLPGMDEIAKKVAGDKQLLADYALVLPEKERADFLAMIPDDKRPAVARELDLALAPLLHQAVVEKKSEEENQRRAVRNRLHQELQASVERKKFDERVVTKKLAEAVGTLGEDTRQLLLDLIRDESEPGGTAEKMEAGHLPRVIKVFLDNFDDWRGNDIILRLAGDPRLNNHLALYLFGKLSDKGYLPKDVSEWWKERGLANRADRKKLPNAEQTPAAVQSENRRLEVLRSVVGELGVMPSKEILEFIYDDKNWRVKNITERVADIRSKQTEFEKFTDSRSLVEALRRDTHSAMIYYLLHGGDDRFNLINNYSFAKFKEMLDLIGQLKVHREPMRQFASALERGGMKKSDIASALGRLESGHFFDDNSARAYQEVSFEVSENAAIKNANAEIGRAMGRGELGVVLIFPLYREYLQQEKSKEADRYLAQMSLAQTFADRGQLIAEIDREWPDLRARAKDDLRDNWKKLGEKMLLEATLDSVFDDERIAIRGEELIPRLDAKRLDLKKMKKDLLVALRGGNERAKAVVAEISRKKKALGNLREGLERAEEKNKPRLEKQIATIQDELTKLENERQMVLEMKVEDRFAGLSANERNKKIDEIGQEIIALTEKSPSAIFTFISMQVLGEERLRESDVALVQELESHLQGPFQTIQDTLTYVRPMARGEEKKHQRVGLRYVDKTKQLMNMVRFADSKICCFSSNNYTMVVQHGTENKYWVASINADPLSFVISMEKPQGDVPADASKQTPSENLGFIFGSFAVDEDGRPALMLNGIYYAPGIEGGEQVTAILDGVKKMFAGLPVKTLAIASQYGGSVKMPDSLTNDPIALTRLRALDDGSGDPENKIYDDLSTGDKLNSQMTYNSGGRGNVWHSKV